MPFTIPGQELLNLEFRVVPGGFTIEFPAYISNVTDRYSPMWNQFFEIGRADHKVLYNKFVREVDIQFRTIADGSYERALGLKLKLNELAKSTYPRDVADGFQGNFLEFTIGALYQKEIGYVSQLQYNWDNTETSWDGGNPFYTTVNMSIVWIGKERPRSEIDAYNPGSRGDWKPVL